jgi:hypothetical protein
MKFKVGDRAEKSDGYFNFKGYVVGAFYKRNGTEWFVVEDEHGRVVIFSGDELTMIEPTKPTTRNVPLPFIGGAMENESMIDPSSGPSGPRLVERIVNDLLIAASTGFFIWAIWWFADAMYHIATWPGLPH